jgi:ubiquinone/menaquinone biosynthesis C-methylase UbiE
MTKYTEQQILDLYKSEADKHGEAGTATIQDMRTRLLEVEAIAGYIRPGMRVLEIGCGNGYTAQQLVERFDIELSAFDFSPDLIAVAQRRDLSAAKGRASFAQGDVLALEAVADYDLAFTERVLQNLLDWPAQQRALGHIIRALKPGGLFVMEECFWSGLNTLNAARAELDLPAIPESWHNLFFHDDQVIAALAGMGAELIDDNRFLSGYYFGSRVLLPALLPAGKTAGSASVLNDYFCALPPAGNFSPMKILAFRKRPE